MPRKIAKNRNKNRSSGARAAGIAGSNAVAGSAGDRCHGPSSSYRYATRTKERLTFQSWATGARTCARVCACARSCAHASPGERMSACLPVCRDCLCVVCVCARVRVCACVRACVRACLHACMRSCMRACVRVCVRAHVRQGSMALEIHIDEKAYQAVTITI